MFPVPAWLILAQALPSKTFTCISARGKLPQENVTVAGTAGNRGCRCRGGWTEPTECRGRLYPDALPTPPSPAARRARPRLAPQLTSFPCCSCHQSGLKMMLKGKKNNKKTQRSKNKQQLARAERAAAGCLRGSSATPSDFASSPRA